MKNWQEQILDKNIKQTGIFKTNKMEAIQIKLTELTFETLKNVFTENYKNVAYTRMQEDGTEGNVYKDCVFVPSIYAGQKTKITDQKDFDYFKNSQLKKRNDLILILNPFAKNWFEKIIDNNENVL